MLCIVQYTSLDLTALHWKLHFTVPYCCQLYIILHCTIEFCTIHYTSLYRTALHRTLYFTAPYTILNSEQSKAELEYSKLPCRTVSQAWVATQFPGVTSLVITLLFFILHCTALHCTALHCTALHCTALHCTTLHCTALSFTLQCTAMYCSILAIITYIKPKGWVRQTRQQKIELYGIVGWMCKVGLYSNENLLSKESCSAVLFFLLWRSAECGRV